MAVRAQYPSNILLLNRNGQEGKKMIGGDYALQLQAEELAHQSQMLYGNGGGANPCKRSRETEMPVSLFHPQSQPPPPALVSLAQIHKKQPVMVSTGLRLSFEDQQQHQMGLFLPSSSQSSSCLEDLAPHIKQHNDEIDQFLQVQGEQLRRTLAERREAHYRTLVLAAEESVARRLREEEAEVEKAARRGAELEERLGQVRAEVQLWQAQARAQEAMAASLEAQLQQAMIGGNKRDEMPADDAESAHIDPRRVESSPPLCRACGKRVASVVLLPCRHLSLCDGCDTVVDTCPLCHSVKNTSVQVRLS